jgi:hypothetical protein
MTTVVSAGRSDVVISENNRDAEGAMRSLLERSGNHNIHDRNHLRAYRQCGNQL